MNIDEAITILQRGKAAIEASAWFAEVAMRPQDASRPVSVRLNWGSATNGGRAADGYLQRAFTALLPAVFERAKQFAEEDVVSATNLLGDV